MRKLLYTSAIAAAIAAFSGPASAAMATYCLGDFTRVDANGDGRISPQEAKAAAEADFDVIDADGSGIVSKAEWQNCGLAAELRAEGDFAHADVDQSGDISREEAANAAEIAYSGIDTKLTQEEYARAYGARFSALDANGDDVISQEEWSDRTASAPLVDASFDRLDADNDGELSKSEYLEARNVEGETPVTVWRYFIFR